MGNLITDNLERYIVIVLLVGGGAFAVICSCKDYDWFMAHPRAQFFVNLIGRRGTHIFYIVLGSALLAAGLFLAFSIPAR